MDLEFSWDEAKREWVLAERKIDFLRLAQELFDGRTVLTAPARKEKDEERFLTIGRVRGKFFALIWTHREAKMRLITARRARHAEEKQYRALHDG
jgi:uncharacterized DUF497 family protein